MDERTAMAAFKKAVRIRSDVAMRPGAIFRVPGYSGIWSDGVEWVIDTNGGQDWRYVRGKGLMKGKWSI
jgi:hypothetical protein